MFTIFVYVSIAILVTYLTWKWCLEALYGSDDSLENVVINNLLMFACLIPLFLGVSILMALDLYSFALNVVIFIYVIIITWLINFAAVYIYSRIV